MPSEMMQPKGLSSSSFFSDEDVCFPNERQIGFWKTETMPDHYALVLAPTHELCMQVYEILHKLLYRFHWIVPGYIMGGENRSKEKAGCAKVEKLIKELPSMLADLSNGDLNSAEKDHLSKGISFQHTANGTNPREAQSMLLERIASEMNRLKFYITHAQKYVLL